QLRHSSLAQKFEDYRQFIDREIYRSHFGFPIVPLVPIITVSEPRMRNMMTLLAEVYGRKGSKYFLFRAIPAFASFEQSIPIIDDLSIGAQKGPPIGVQKGPVAGRRWGCP